MMRWRLSGCVWRLDWHFDAYGEQVVNEPHVYVAGSFYHYYDSVHRACEVLKEFAKDERYFDLHLCSE